MSRGETLKGASSSLPGCLSPPGCRPVAGDGCDKPGPGSKAQMTTTLERPAESAGALYVKTPVTPKEIFRAIGRLRKEAMDEIDRLIRFLDSTENHMAIDCEPEDEGDGDCDLEHGADDEPSLGSHEIREAGAVSYLHHYISDGWEMLADCEADDCDREDDDPDEAKLQPAVMGGAA